MDITNSITKINTDIGVRKENDLISFDGKLKLEINLNKLDVEKLFIKDVIVLVQIWDDRIKSWKTIWLGLTDKVKYRQGIKTKIATIECLQGIGLLKNIIVEPILKNNIQIDDIIKQILNNTNIKTQYNLDTYRGESKVIPIISTRLIKNNFITESKTNGKGIFNFGLIGASWKPKTNIYAAIQDLLRSENARLWVNRSGYYEFRNVRKFFDFGYIFKKISINNIVDNKFNNRLDIYNKVKVTWNNNLPDNSPKTNIWNLNYRYNIAALSSSKPIKMLFNFSNSTLYDVVDNLDTKDIIIKVYSQPIVSGDVAFQSLYQQYLVELDAYNAKVEKAREDAKKENGKKEDISTEKAPIFEPYLVGHYEEEKYINNSIEYTITKNNSYFYITMYNTNSFPVWVTVSDIKGREFESTTNVFEFTNPLTNTINTKDITSNTLNRPKEAKKLADYFFVRNSKNENKLETITIKDYYLILDTTLGSYLEIDGKKYIVIGEKIESYNQYLAGVYTLMLIPNITYYNVANNRLPIAIGL